MKKFLLLFIFLICLINIPKLLYAKDIHVSINTGNDDTGNGSINYPYKTLEKVKLEARNFIVSGLTEPLTIFIHEGRYVINNSLIFNDLDGGTDNFPVTWQSYNDEKVIITGAFEVSNWVQEGNLFTATVPGTTKYFNRLYKTNASLIRSRMPNIGSFYYINRINPSNAWFGFHYNDNDIRADFTNLTGININLYQNWQARKNWIISVDEGNKYVEFNSYAWKRIGDQSLNTAPYYLDNVFEGLDAPGEWYYMDNEKKIYYYPVLNENISEFKAFVPQLDRLLVFSGNLTTGAFVKNIHFKGITFLYTDWAGVSKYSMEGQAHILISAATIYAEGLQNSSFTNCEIGYTGAHGIVFGKGCINNLVQQCYLHNIGAGGIYIGETGEFNSCKTFTGNETIANNTIHNNFLHDLSEVFHGSVGIFIGNTPGNTVSHNEIMNNDYSGINVGWCWGYAGYEGKSAANTTVKNNYIHHIMNGMLSDGAGIYTLGDLSGSVISGNIIHDVTTYNYIGAGIYLDEGSSNVLVEKNLVYNVSSFNFFYHKNGTGNIIRNNIFAKAGQAPVSLSIVNSPNTCNISRNIILTINGVNVMDDVLNSSESKFDYNLYWDINSGSDSDFDMHTFTEWQNDFSQDINGKIANPLFVDAANNNYKLSSGSPTLTLGFETWNIDTAGLIGNTAWKNISAGIQPATVNPYRIGPSVPRYNNYSIIDNLEQQQTYSIPFQAYAVYQSTADVYSRVNITEERASQGTKSIKMVDHINASNSWLPSIEYLFHWYKPDATFHFSFDIFLEPGISLTYAIRNRANSTIFSFNLNAGSNVVANKWTSISGKWITSENIVRYFIDGTEYTTPLKTVSDYRIHKAVYYSGNAVTANLYLDNVLFNFELKNNDTINLLENWSFESDFVSWNQYGAAITTTDIYHGEKAAQITGSSRGVWRIVNNLEPNTTYHLSSYGKLSDLSQTAFMYVKNYGGTELQSTITSTNYTKQEIVFTTGPASTSAELGVWKTTGTASAYCDAFVLKKDEVITTMLNREPESGLHIYPNPTSDILYFNNLPADATIKVFSADGRLKATYKTKEVVNRIDVSAWQKGVYIISVNNINNIVKEKVIIK